MEQPPKHSLAQSTPQAKKQKVASVDQAAYYLPSKDGPIAGALLMQWLYQTIWPKLQPHTSVPYTFYSIDPIIDSSTGVNKVVGQVRTIRINGGVDWLRTAGRLAKYIPGFCRNYRVEFPLAIIHPGQNSTYLEIIAMEGDEGKTERLYGIIYADDVKLFYDYGFDPFKEPSYAKIDGKLKSIKNGTGSTDIEIANCLSARMKGQDAPVPRLAEH